MERNQHYIYRDYLQIACLDLTRAGTPALWFVFWDPTQPTATRPLAIQKNGTWFVYGHDLTKNVCEVFGSDGYIKTTYSYSPFGNVSSVGNFEQNFQWSSEFYDSDLNLVYYNYRHYSPTTARWLSRDPIEERGGLNLYLFCGNDVFSFDDLGMRKRGRQFRGTRYKTRKNAKRLQISRGLAYCANYKKYRNGECCRNGKIVEDSYPKDAQPVCEGFIKDYAGTAMGESAICVAECLSQNEEEMSKISDCANRNSARFESHFACYAKCLFIPYYGLPDGGWDVGVHDLFPDYLKTRILPIFE